MKVTRVRDKMTKFSRNFPIFHAWQDLFKKTTQGNSVVCQRGGLCSNGTICHYPLKGVSHHVVSPAQQTLEVAPHSRPILWARLVHFHLDIGAIEVVIPGVLPGKEGILLVA